MSLIKKEFQIKLQKSEPDLITTHSRFTLNDVTDIVYETVNEFFDEFVCLETMFEEEVRTMRKHWAYYRTKDGRADYRFSFEEQQDGTWRAYIEEQPSYCGRPTDAHATHRLSDNNRKYVCWTDPLKSLAEAKSVAALWADATQKYIQTGQTF
jgi:hypothetical protein